MIACESQVAGDAKLTRQLYPRRYTRPDRDLHVVGIRRYHHRLHCVDTTDSGGLHHRYPSDNITHDVHEQHALCLLVRLRFLLFLQLTPRAGLNV